MGSSCSLEFYRDNEETTLEESEHKTDRNSNLELRSRASRSRSLVSQRNINMNYNIRDDLSPNQRNVLILQHQATNEIYAAKVLLTGYNSYPTLITSFPDVGVPLTLDCPYILKLYQVVCQGRYAYLISEFCGGGTLEARIRDRGRFRESRAKKIMYMLLYGVNHMHQNNYIHRDLAPRNILFESDKRSSIIKIIDFDTTKKMCSEVNQSRGYDYLYHYLAPELIQYYKEREFLRENRLRSQLRSPRTPRTPRNSRNSRRSLGYNEKVDIWSCGVILYQMLSKI